MTSDRFRRVEALYHGAMAQPVSARGDYLAEACAGDVDLRRDVESLIAHAATGGSFLEHPPDIEGTRLHPRIEPGDRLGPYTIMSFLGAGGMGEVYRAHDARLKRDVAIKVLAPGILDPGRERRLSSEAQAAGALNHPNILTVYDIGSQVGPAGSGPPFTYIVMELLEGQTLRDRLSAVGPHDSRGSLPVGEAIGMGLQIAQGLAAAHAKGIIHRDLKPENLFITTDGRVKILDFGLAKHEIPDTLAPVTDPGTILGTAGYMAPEQVRGEPADDRSDLFAFGAILFEIVTGLRAFGSASAVEAMSAILRDDPPGLSSVDRDVPPGLEAIVRRCLQKRAADRFPSARQLVVALEELKTGDVAAPNHRRTRRAVLAGGMALVGMLGLAGWLDWRGRAHGVRPAPVINSLAVLPLKSLSKDLEDYFTEGMTEELISGLARVAGVRVISRTSTMAYRNTQKPLPQIARELQVDAIVEWSIRRSGDRLQITARLFHAPTDQQAWMNTYERAEGDLVALPAEVAAEIAHGVRGTLAPTPAASRQPPPTAAVHEAYLRGRYFLGKGTRPDIDKAIAYFTEATERQPDYAPPYAGLADAYTALRSVYLSPHEVMPRAKAAAQHALTLDPDLADAHVSMGGVLMYYDFDWPAAEGEFRRAIELNPNLAIAHDYYAMYLAALGRHDEARVEADRAKDLDPLSLPILVDTGWVHYLARRYDAMVAVNQHATELDPEFYPALRDLGLGYEKFRRFPEAVTSIKRARKIDNNSTVLEMLGGAYASWGKREEAQAVLNELSAEAAKRYICPYEIATVHAGLGDTKAALSALEKGFQERADCMPWAGSDPKLDSLHAIPQFQDLMRRLGLPFTR